MARPANQSIRGIGNDNDSDDKTTTTIAKAGKKPLTFKKGALHTQLGVPQDQPIPAAKKQAALSGRLGPLAKKRATFAFKGALAKGRETASK